MIMFNCSCGSTLTIKGELFDWFSPTKLMSPEQKLAFGEMKMDDSLPRVSAQIFEIQEKVLDERLSAQALADAIRGEPALAAEILHLANLKVGGKAGRVQQLAHAIAYLSRKELQQFVLMATVKDFSFKAKIFSFEKFWRKSLMTGRVASYLCPKFFPKCAELAFIYGSLLNVGKLALGFYQPRLIDRLIKTSLDADLSWNMVEGELAFNHRMLGTVAGIIWAFPNDLIEIIDDHHTSFTKSTFSSLLRFSNEWSHILLDEPQFVDREILECGFQVFQFEEQRLLEEMKAAISVTPIAA
ncbi:HDOD domain-containing protein [Pseudobacteriovorax antillogorgiicola]|uniref:HDOD domain-containing protein n=1 Tax=Pseudobacteriovorax antillogorgiicola TaxID=1513793 RepID=UPI001F391211|nr:HDOD domain-containing protein [Pseudobacteriovorax antillogorgiicola]